MCSWHKTAMPETRDAPVCKGCSSCTGSPGVRHEASPFCSYASFHRCNRICRLRSGSIANIGEQHRLHVTCPWQLCVHTAEAKVVYMFFTACSTQCCEFTYSCPLTYHTFACTAQLQKTTPDSSSVSDQQVGVLKASTVSRTRFSL